MTMLLIAMGIWIGGGILAMALDRSPEWSTRVGVGTAVTGCVLGLWPAFHGLLAGGVESVRFPWAVPGGEFYVQLDGLSCFFLVPICVLSALAAVYGGDYMASYSGRKSLGPHWFCFNLFLAGMALVVVAHHALLFLVAWEVMSLAAFCLVIFEHERKDVCAAGWIYLIATHVGALALAAVPPLNGFVSEWLIYMALLTGGLEFSGGSRMVLLMMVGGLALVGGLAMICFVRLIGIVWLGEGRSEEARHAHESSCRMVVPMEILAGFCVLAAVFPGVLLPMFSRTVETAFSMPGGSFMAALNSTQSPLGVLSQMNVVIWVMLALVGVLFLLVVRRGRVTAEPTWGCGYLAPTSRIQYTGQSFSELMVSRMFPRAWRPKTRVTAPQGVFPATGKMTTRYPDTLSRIFYQPFFQWVVDNFLRLRWVQQGNVHYYMMYFVVTLVAAFAWMAIRGWVMHG